MLHVRNPSRHVHSRHVSSGSSFVSPSSINFPPSWHCCCGHTGQQWPGSSTDLVQPPGGAPSHLTWDTVTTPSSHAVTSHGRSTSRCLRAPDSSLVPLTSQPWHFWQHWPGSLGWRLEQPLVSGQLGSLFSHTTRPPVQVHTMQGLVSVMCLISILAPSASSRRVSHATPTPPLSDSSRLGLQTALVLTLSDSSRLGLQTALVLTLSDSSRLGGLHNLHP